MKLGWANRVTVIRILLIIPFVSCLLKLRDPALEELTGNLIRYGALLIFILMAERLEVYRAQTPKSPSGNMLQHNLLIVKEIRCPDA